MSQRIHVIVRCFSHVKHALGRDELTVELPRGASAGDVEARVREMGGEKIGAMPFRLAVNQSFVQASTILEDGDEVALIPPVQGGRPGETG